jgi:hypothetical protein
MFPCPPFCDALADYADTLSICMSGERTPTLTATRSAYENVHNSVAHVISLITRNSVCEKKTDQKGYCDYLITGK